IANKKLIPPCDRTMPVTNVSSLVELLRQHQVLEPAQLDEVARTHAADPRTLAQSLVKRAWLTPYQANQLFLSEGRELSLGPYLLLERLSEGGAGQVYKALHRPMKRIVAVKVIRRELLQDSEMVSRFQREVQLISKLSHPNLVKAYDAGTSGDAIYL